jgi:hypothetical protein
VATLWLAIRPAFYGIVRNYNEGWNAYWQGAAAAGESIYPEPPGLTWNNYPPLGFYLTGWPGSVVGDQIAAGRVASVIGLLVVAAFAAVTATRLSASRVGGLISGGLVVLVFAGFYRNYVGMNDPQLVAHAIMTGAVWVAVRFPPSRRVVVGVVALAAIALLVKHNLLAFPLAYGVWMLLDVRRYRPTLAFAAVLAVLISVCLPVVLYGTAYVSQLLAGRQYSIDHGAQVLLRSVLPLTPLLALVVWWGVGNWAARRDVRLVLGYVLSSLLVAVVFAGGEGINYNVGFDVAIAVTLAAGPAVVQMARTLRGRRATLPAMALSLGASVYLAMAVLPEVRALIDEPALSASERETTSDIAYLANRPGRAACVNLALCERGGKAFEIDFFGSWQAVATRRMSSGLLAEPFVTGQLATVQLSPDFPSAHSPMDALLRQALLEGGYRVDRTSSLGQYWVLAPAP